MTTTNTGRTNAATDLSDNENHLRRIAVRWVIIALAGSLSGACAVHKSEKLSEIESCRSGPAKAMVGKSGLSDTEILHRAGATMLRRIAPGDPVTRDYRRERVTVTLDHTGMIVAASCG